MTGTDQELNRANLNGPFPARPGADSGVRVLFAVALGILLGGGVVMLPALLFVESRLKQEMVAREVERVHRDVERQISGLRGRLRATEESARRFAAIVTDSIEAPNPDLVAEFHSLVRQDPDGAWRSDSGTFNPENHAAVWIPAPTVTGDDVKCLFIQLKRVTEAFGNGAGRTPHANAWVMPAIGGEVIFWPDRPGYCAEIPATFDYRLTPWFQSAAPEKNPKGDIRWTPPLFDPVTRLLMTSAVAPFKQNGRFAGSVGHDILIGTIMEESVPSEGGRLDAFTFLTTGDGTLLESSAFRSQIRASSGTLTLDGIPDPQLRDTLRAARRQLDASPGTDPVHIHNPESDTVAVRVGSPDWTMYHVIPRHLVVAMLDQPFRLIRFMFLISMVFALLAAGIAVWRDLARRRHAADQETLVRSNLESLFDAMDDMVLVVDEREWVMAANRPARERLGLTGESLSAGLRLSAILTPDVIANHGLRTEHNLKLPDGELLPVDVNRTRGTWAAGQATFVVARDVRERRRSQEALVRAGQEWKSTFDAVPDLIALIDTEHRIVRVNRAMARALSRTPEECEKLLCHELVHGTPGPPAMCPHTATLASGASHSHDFFERRLGGHYQVTTTPLHDEHGRLIGSAHLARDISEQQRMEERLRFDALHDSLTRLPNRALLIDRLNRAAARMKRNPSARFAVLFLDLDDFKKINDSLGHQAGDALLLDLANRFEACLRPEDTIARLGGDEFAILVEGLTAREDAHDVAARLLDVVSRPFDVLGHAAYVTGSIGIAHSGPGNNTPEDLLRNADTAMYVAKREGRNRFCEFSEAMHERVIDRLSVESGLRRAATLDQFFVEYQPIVDLRTGRAAGFEALVRWNHPDRGRVGPNDFIEVAEESGLIQGIGAWVLETACVQAAAWERRFGRSLILHVNISGRQIQSGHFVGVVEHALATSGLPHASLALEVTETILIEQACSVDVLARLNRLGVRICLDDFGTGYSSLCYLHRFPVKEVKVDRSFVGRMDEERSDMEIVRAIQGLARAFDLKLVAEGVETASQARALKRLRYDYAQGYLFSVPLPPEQMEAWLEESEAGPGLAGLWSDDDAPEAASTVD